MQCSASLERRIKMAKQAEKKEKITALYCRLSQDDGREGGIKAREKILSHLSPEVTSIDELIRETGLRTELVNAILLEMELSGIIERFVGQRVSLVYNNEWTK